MRLAAGNSSKYCAVIDNYNNQLRFFGGANNGSGNWVTGTYLKLDTGVLMGAAWNDYAECRATEPIEAGRVVRDQDNGTMTMTTERLAPGAKIVSDTYAMLIGTSDTVTTPIAVAGRVLAYPYRNRNEYHAGDAVCAAPNGTVDIMTREEIQQYPDCIIGTVSEIPTYDVWESTSTTINDQKSYASTKKVEVKGRIWIYVK